MLTQHFSILEKLTKEINIDAKRLWNLDESESTLGKKQTGASQLRRVIREN